MATAKLTVLRALDWARTHKALVVAVLTAAVSVAQHVWPGFPAADVLDWVGSAL